MRALHKVVILIAASLGLSGCAYNPYFPGRSAADVPATINVIRLQEASLASVNLHSHGAPSLDATPSDNSLKVLAVAKAAAIAQFQNFGYRVIEDDSKKPDVLAKIYVTYIPEAWPLVDRSCFVAVRISSVQGQGLLDQYDLEMNGAGLVGAVVGPSRDQMATMTAQKAVQKAVAVMQKGTGGSPPASGTQISLGN